MVRVQEVRTERRHSLDQFLEFDFERVFIERIRRRHLQTGVLEQCHETDRLGGFVFEHVPQKLFFHVGGHRLERGRAAAKFFELRAQFGDAFFLAGIVAGLNDSHVWLLKVRG